MKEALKLALEALQKNVHELIAENKALKKALAQPDREPVAWRAWFDADNSAKWLFTLWPEEEHPSFDWQPLYTTPPQRKPLTDEELRVIENKINPNMRWRSSDEEGITLYPSEYYELVRAIEAAHGIKE